MPSSGLYTAEELVGQLLKVYCNTVMRCSRTQATGGGFKRLAPTQVSRVLRWCSDAPFLRTTPTASWFLATLGDSVWHGRLAGALTTSASTRAGHATVPTASSLPTASW